MFFKNSRYRQLPDEVTVDVKGRRLLSKSLRLLPEVTGIFQHTVDEADRLDHLAYKYYKQSRKWWRICDANPEFLWPQALLGKTPLVTQFFPLTYNDSEPPWAELLAELAKQVGVLDVQLGDDDLGVVIVYNQINIQIKGLSEVMEAVGFAVGEPQTIGRLGKRIVIPPDVVG
jgi:hypothetical protein